VKWLKTMVTQQRVIHTDQRKIHRERERERERERQKDRERGIERCI